MLESLLGHNQVPQAPSTHTAAAAASRLAIALPPPARVRALPAPTIPILALPVIYCHPNHAMVHADVPSHEGVTSTTVVRALSLPKAAWELLVEQFPAQARIVLENLQVRGWGVWSRGCRLAGFAGFRSAASRHCWVLTALWRSLPCSAESVKQPAGAAVAMGTH